MVCASMQFISTGLLSRCPNKAVPSSATRNTLTFLRVTQYLLLKWVKGRHSVILSIVGHLIVFHKEKERSRSNHELFGARQHQSWIVVDWEKHDYHYCMKSNTSLCLMYIQQVAPDVPLYHYSMKSNASLCLNLMYNRLRQLLLSLATLYVMIINICLSISIYVLCLCKILRQSSLPLLFEI